MRRKQFQRGSVSARQHGRRKVWVAISGREQKIEAVTKLESELMKASPTP